MTSEASFRGIVPIHFGVPNHSLALSSYLKTAMHVQSMSKALGSEIFGDKFEFEVFVLPPESGGLFTRFQLKASSKSKKKIRLGSLLVGGVSLLALPWLQDVGQGIIEGYSGATGAEVGRDIGENIKNYFDDELVSEDAKVSLVEDIISKSTVGFIGGETDSLKSMGLNPSNFTAGFEARNGFFETCLADSRINAIGFDRSHDFSIQHEDFRNFIVPLDEELEESLTPLVGIADIKVTSPNWERGDTRRAWIARDKNDSIRRFFIDDEGFWLKALNDKLDFQRIDSLKVQWAYNELNSKMTHIHVLKVLEFNGARLAEPFEGEELSEVIGAYERIEHATPETLDMFEDF